MATFIPKPTIIEAAGQPPKLIEEFIGRVNSGTAAVSIARMKSPSGWSEPGQTPEFDEYTVVLRGTLHVKLKDPSLMSVPGRRSSSGRGMGAIQQPVAGRCGVYRRLHPGLFARNGSSGGRCAQECRSPPAADCVSP